MKHFLFFLFACMVSISANATEYYVATNGNDTTGNGTEGSPWKTIAYAMDRQLFPGDTVLVSPGVYPNEEIEFTNSGSAAVQLTTGVSVEGANQMRFPSSTDLSAINLSNTNQYYLYVYRSWLSNNGVFPVTNVVSEATNRIVQVEGAADWVAESGIPGDPAYLSACVARPVVLKNSSTNREMERVIVDGSGSSIYTMWFVGEYINDSDANAADYNLFDGFDLTGMQGGGIHLQDSSYNVFMDVRVYNGGASGILMAGNTNDAAEYNIIIRSKVWNTPYEGIYLGAGGHPRDECHLYYPHVIDCEIFTTGTTAQADMENAIDLKEYNIGQTVEGCDIHDVRVATFYNGALFVQHHTRDTLIYNNTFRDITYDAAAQRPVAAIQMDLEGVQGAAVFNNVISRTNTVADETYAFAIVGHDTATNVVVVNNTVANMDRALYLGYYSSGTYDLTLANNIFDCHDSASGLLYIDGDDGARTVTHNFWMTAPAIWSSEPGRLTGSVSFADSSGGDFRLSAGSPAIDSGTNLYTWLMSDADGKTRPIDGDGDSSVVIDRGAYEYGQLTPDLSPPSVPDGLGVVTSTASSIWLQWHAATDDVEVVRYRISRDGASVGTSTTTNYTDTGLTAENCYTYRVRAEDATGNTSAWSTAVQGCTTEQDFSDPSVPQNLRLLKRSVSSQTIAWDASTDNVAVVEYEIERQGSVVASTSSPVYTNVGLASASNYVYRVRAVDAESNYSGFSSSLTAPTWAQSALYRLLFDFGNPSYETAGNWNQVSSASPNGFTGIAVTNAIDTNGVSKSVDLALINDFYDDTSGGDNSDGAYPASAIRDGWWLGNYGGYGEADTTGGVRLAGFEPGDAVTLKILGSRSDATYDRQTFAWSSASSGSVDALYNVNQVVTLNETADASGGVEFFVKPLLSSGFGYLNVLDVLVQAASSNEVTLRGTPYSWLQMHYPEESDRPEWMDLLDTDGDGHAAWQEWVAGTQPTNAMSVLKVDIPVRDVLQWDAVQDRRYSVGYNTNLVIGFGSSWVVTNLSVGIWTDTLHQINSSGYYRLRVEYP